MTYFELIPFLIVSRISVYFVTTESDDRSTFLDINRIFKNIRWMSIRDRCIGVLAENSLRTVHAWQISRETELLIRSVSSWLRYRPREAEGNKGRKKISSHRSLRVVAYPPPRDGMDGWMDRWMAGWIPSLSSRTPVLQTEQASPCPQNLSAERAYFHLTRLGGRLILLKTPVTRFRTLSHGEWNVSFALTRFPQGERDYFRCLDDVRQAGCSQNSTDNEIQSWRLKQIYITKKLEEQNINFQKLTDTFLDEIIRPKFFN